MKININLVVGLLLFVSSVVVFLYCYLYFQPRSEYVVIPASLYFFSGFLFSLAVCRISIRK